MVENINNRHADRATNKEPVNNSIAINCTSHAIRPGFFCNYSPSAARAWASPKWDRGDVWLCNLHHSSYAPRPKAFFAAPLIDAPLFHINTQSDALIVLYCILRQAARVAFYLWDTARNFNYRNGTHNVTTTVGVNDQSIWRRSQLAEIKHRKRTSYTPWKWRWGFFMMYQNKCPRHISASMFSHFSGRVGRKIGVEGKLN